MINGNGFLTFGAICHLLGAGEKNGKKVNSFLISIRGNFTRESSRGFRPMMPLI